MAKSKSQKNQKRKQETQPRAERGRVAISRPGEPLKIRIPAKHSPTGKQCRYAFGLSDTPENRAKAEAIAAQINARIFVFKNYDPQKLREYIFGEAVSTEPDPNLNLSHPKERQPLDRLWELFSVYKKDVVKLAPATMENYAVFGSRIQKLSTKSLSDAETIIAELRSGTCGPRESYRTLRHISLCCDWAVENEIIDRNPFKKKIEGLPKPDSESDPDPFTVTEVERILAAFAAHPKYKRYVPYILFKLKTGCRPSEATGLRWRHIDFEKGEIIFYQTISRTNGKNIPKDGTKTVLRRTFPMSLFLRKLLKKIMPAQVYPDAFVFQEPDGEHFDVRKFYKAWYTHEYPGRPLKNGEIKQYRYPGIVSELAEIPYEKGGISHYRPPYTTRHTFITEALQEMARNGKLTPKNIARLAKITGTSPKTIYEYYLGIGDDNSIVDVSLGDNYLEIDDDFIPDASVDNGSELPSTPQPEDMQAGNRGFDSSPSADLITKLEELQRQNQILQQELDQLRSSQETSQSPVPVEEQIETASVPEAELTELARYYTIIDELF